MTRFEALLRRLSDSRVELVVVGGLAVIAHGYPRATVDLDLCYARTPENIRKLAGALAPIHPRLRGVVVPEPGHLTEENLVDLEALRAIAAKR